MIRTRHSLFFGRNTVVYSLPRPGQPLFLAALLSLGRTPEFRPRKRPWSGLQIFAKSLFGRQFRHMDGQGRAAKIAAANDLQNSADGRSRRPKAAPNPPAIHSHSIVAGGLLEMSYTTRLIPRTSLMIRLEIVASTSYGTRAQSAVMKSWLSTARRATTWS
jgi:hypothetical protein